MTQAIQAIRDHLPSNPFRSAPVQSTSITGKMWTAVKAIDNKAVKVAAGALAALATIFTLIADGAVKVGNGAKNLANAMSEAGRALKARFSKEVPETRKEKAVRIARQVLPYAAGVVVLAGLGYAAYTYGPAALEAAREFVSPAPTPAPTGWFGS